MPPRSRGPDASLVATIAVIAFLTTPALAISEKRCPSSGGTAQFCLSAQQQMREETQAFRGGDYGAMRNRAFCLWTGCDGAFEIDREQSCAIRREIIRRHARRFDRTDEGHLASCTQRGL